MPRTVWFRGLVFGLLLVLIAPSAFAAGSRERDCPSAPSVVSTLWQALVKLVPFVGKSSGTMDPDGQPHAFVGAGAQTDSSGTMDPDGLL